MDFGVFFILKEKNMDTKKVVTNETSNDVKREKVRVISIQFFDDFPKPPFNVKMDEEMEALIRSIGTVLPRCFRARDLPQTSPTTPWSSPGTLLKKLMNL